MTEQEFYIWLGKKLKSLRESKGFTRREMQEKIGINPNFLSNIENYGHKISVYQLNVLLEAMGMKQADLFEDTEKKTSSFLSRGVVSLAWQQQDATSLLIDSPDARAQNGGKPTTLKAEEISFLDMTRGLPETSTLTLESFDGDSMRAGAEFRRVL